MAGNCGVQGKVETWSGSGVVRCLVVVVLGVVMEAGHGDTGYCGSGGGVVSVSGNDGAGGSCCGCWGRQKTVVGHPCTQPETHH